MGQSLDLTKWVQFFRKGPVTLELFSSQSEANGFFSFAAFQIAFVMFAVYTLVNNTHVLDAQKSFVSLTLINILNTAHSFLPFSINAVVQVNCRLCSFPLGISGVFYISPLTDKGRDFLGL